MEEEPRPRIGMAGRCLEANGCGFIEVEEYWCVNCGACIYIDPCPACIARGYKDRIKMTTSNL